jgi:hypothetical protein
MANALPGLNQDGKSSLILSPQAQTDLFGALDLTRPELASVAAALKRNDPAGAQKKLAEYFRMRTSVHWKADSTDMPTLSSKSQMIADAAVEGKLQGGLVPLVYAFPQGDIDWHFNLTFHKLGQVPNNEWQWQLNRMSFWSDLAAAYSATRDERYAEAFVQELRSWIAQSPVPDYADNDPGSTWRTIEAGIRSSGSWMDAFYAFRRSPTMSDADVLAMVHAFLDHGRYLRNRHTKMNWLTMEMSGLYSVGAEFPEFKEAVGWRSFAANTLAEEAHKQFLPDGAQMEISTGYQNVALDNILLIAEIARWTGHASELPPGYAASLEKAYEWQAAIIAPDGDLPRINDSWYVYMQYVWKKAATNFPNQPEFQWFASNRRKGTPPQFTSIYLDRSGLAVMRSGWNADANYSLFRVGPLGMGHQHQDSLGINMWAYGRELIFNSGGGEYEKSKWRDWAISAFSSNTVVVDHMAQTRTMSQNDPLHDPNMVSQGPIDAHWKSNDVFDFSSGVYNQGYGPSHVKIATQQRDVLFLKPDVYIVADRLTPNDSGSHQFQARWNILTTHSRIDPVTQTLVTTDRGMANIAVVPLLVDHLQINSVSGQEKPEILGWKFSRDPNAELVPATTLLHSVAGAGPHRFLTLFVPLRPGKANPIAKVEPGGDGISAMAIFTDGRRLLISCPGSIGISVQEILPDGKVGRSVAGEE